MAQRLGNSLKSEIPAIDKVIGAQSLETIEGNLHHYLGKKMGVSAFKHEQNNTISTFLPIMRGCDNYCAYCVVPYVRGKEHSLPMHSLLEKAKLLVDQGAKEIVLLGQNVNSYNDGENNFSDLLTHFHKIEELKRIRFTTSHPKDISDTLIRTVAELPKICNHIHLPVQSGSTGILKSMHRQYSREEYLKRIEMIKKILPNVDITTDVMVGFPGEQNSDFKQTVSLFEEIRFTNAFMFAFSKRTGTKAAKMPGQIPDLIKKERLKILIHLQTDITKNYYQNMVNTNVDVLFIKKQVRKDQAWMGQDNGCKRVLLNSLDDLSGTMLNVHVVKSTGMTLVSER